MKAKALKRATTIYEIAERAGVSSSTVARALNGENKEKSSGSASRAERIRRIAEQMQYRPNWRARAFAEGKTHSVGLFQPNWLAHLDGVNTGIGEGLISELYKNRYHVVLVPIGDDDEWRRMLVEQQLDGCALLQQLGDSDSVLDVVGRYDIPSVLINNAEGNQHMPRVTVDEFTGAQLAVKHLKLLGHKRIGFYIDKEAQDHYSVSDRISGFKTELGIDEDDDSMVWRASEQSIISRLVDGDKDRPTAVICYSHFEAIPLLHSLSQFGIQVPRDLSMVCFNDIYPTQYLNPPMTTIAYDTIRMGRVAAQMLMRQIRGEWDGTEHTSITMKQHLIVRGSTGPVPTES